MCKQVQGEGEHGARLPAPQRGEPLGMRQLGMCQVLPPAGSEGGEGSVRSSERGCASLVSVGCSYLLLALSGQLGEVPLLLLLRLRHHLRDLALQCAHHTRVTLALQRAHVSLSLSCPHVALLPYNPRDTCVTQRTAGHRRSQGDPCTCSPPLLHPSTCTPARAPHANAPALCRPA